MIALEFSMLLECIYINDMIAVTCTTMFYLKLSNDEDVSGLASWKTGYTAAIVGAALFIFLILVFAGVVQQRSSQT